ncbi:hypothetical protein BDV10DRAFT_140260 [Aspergillus recurvatus]
MESRARNSARRMMSGRPSSVTRQHRLKRPPETASRHREGHTLSPQWSVACPSSMRLATHCEDLADSFRNCIVTVLYFTVKAAHGLMPIMSAHVMPSCWLIGCCQDLWGYCPAAFRVALGLVRVGWAGDAVAKRNRNLCKANERDGRRHRTKERFSLPSQNHF